MSQPEDAKGTPSTPGPSHGLSRALRLPRQLREDEIEQLLATVSIDVSSSRAEPFLKAVEGARERFGARLADEINAWPSRKANNAAAWELDFVADSVERLAQERSGASQGLLLNEARWGVYRVGRYALRRLVRTNDLGDRVLTQPFINGDRDEDGRLRSPPWAPLDSPPGPRALAILDQLRAHPPSMPRYEDLVWLGDAMRQEAERLRQETVRSGRPRDVTLEALAFDLAGVWAGCGLRLAHANYDYEASHDEHFPFAKFVRLVARATGMDELGPAGGWRVIRDGAARSPAGRLERERRTRRKGRAPRTR